MVRKQSEQRKFGKGKPLKSNAGRQLSGGREFEDKEIDVRIRGEH